MILVFFLVFFYLTVQTQIRMIVLFFIQLLRKERKYIDVWPLLNLNNQVKSFLDIESLYFQFYRLDGHQKLPDSVVYCSKCYFLCLESLKYFKRYISNELVSIHYFLVFHILELLSLNVLPKGFKHLHSRSSFQVYDFSQILINLESWRVGNLCQYNSDLLWLSLSLRKLEREAVSLAEIGKRFFPLK